jgi:hypothetical protein
MIVQKLCHGERAAGDQFDGRFYDSNKQRLAELRRIGRSFAAAAKISRLNRCGFCSLI